VAIPTRIDRARIDRATSPVRTLSRRPIVLARLPHVGAELRVESQEPRVESQEDNSPSAALQHGYSPESQTRSHRQKEHVTGLRESSPRKMVRTPSPPTGLSSTLFSLHTQLAPFAGAIVALALVASAGLLYWMIVSPSRMTTDFHEAFQGGFEASTAELPKFAPQLPSFTSQTTTGISETAALETPSWDFSEGVTEVSPKPREETPLEEAPEVRLQEEELVVMLEEPAIEPLIESIPVSVPEQTVRLVEGPAFPTTNHPTALDFAKLGAGLKRQ